MSARDRTGQVWEVGGHVYLVHETYEPERDFNIFLHRVACISSTDNPCVHMGESASTPWEATPDVHRRIA